MDDVMNKLSKDGNFNEKENLNYLSNLVKGEAENIVTSSLDEANKIVTSSLDETDKIVTSSPDEKIDDEQQGNNEDLKKKKKSFLWRDIQITNPAEVESNVLLEIMSRRCNKLQKEWSSRANMLRSANTCITAVVICVQVVQVFTIHSPGYFGNNGKLLATILPAFTGAMIGTQQKLSWEKKASAAKKNAQFFSKLQHHVEYRLHLVEAGAKVTDVIKLWNISMRTEACEIPPPIFPY